MSKTIIDKVTASVLPVPTCMVNRDGKIIGVNSRIEEVFPYGDIEDADFFALTGVRTDRLVDENNGKLLIERNGSHFNIISDRSKIDEEGYISVFFINVTGREKLKAKYYAERVCICRISIDNYDEFTDIVSPETGISVTGQVDKLIRDLAERINAPINKIKNTLYLIYFQEQYFDELSRDKFSILDEVRAIDTGTDFPLTLSIGVGIGGRSIEETAQFAVAALDLALGRGGDQAVVKQGDELSYYGGRTQSISKSTKGKSRIIALALNKLVEQSNRVIIMGHKHADMDSFGAAIGIYRLCISSGTDTYIAIDEISDPMQEIYNEARSSERYNLISTERARDLMDKNTVLIVVDTQSPNYIEDPALLDMAEIIVVIDHHRRTESYIEGATLSYIEAYASSASELVSEMLQYIVPKEDFIKFEAEALLAGMTVDTNSFSIKTGVRTFEAAAWLRRAGADTTEVKRFFQMSPELVKAKAKIISNTEFHPGGIATSVAYDRNEDAQVINAQVADELLEIKGINVSIVAGEDLDGVTCVSARSIGDVNVQVLTEKFGGGGHLNIAGAQVEIPPEEVIRKMLSILSKERKNESNTEK
jgi:c-di-AMP phosphodiesterase-like protein